MQHHLDQNLAEYILSRLTNGFCIGFDSWCHQQCNSRNLHSSTKQPLIVQQHIEVEWARVHLAHISPMGLVPKPYSDKWQTTARLCVIRNT